MSIKEELIQSCHTVGRKIPLWIQGPGGNISVKDGDNLIIKASGARLDQVSESQGLATASLKIFKKLWNSKTQTSTEDHYSEMIRECALQGRPSMETGFHALLPRKWVAHFHALSGLLMAHQNKKDPRRFEEFWKSYGQGLKHKIFEPIMPGLLLSEKISQTPDADLFILENHGVVLQSNDGLDSALKKFEAIESAFLKAYSYGPLQPGTEAELTKLDLRLYFPDSAVLIDKIEMITEKVAPGSSQRKLKQGAAQINLDAFELLWGTATLTRAEPLLAELPLEISQKVANLPTELIRKTALQS